MQSPPPDPAPASRWLPSFRRTHRGVWYTLACAPAALAALGACAKSPQQLADGDDPLAALTSSVASTRYNQGFWREHAHADSAPGSLWGKALAYCGHLGRPRPGLEADGAKPNCGAVNGAEWDVNNERAMREVNARVEAARRRDERMQRDPAYRRQVWDSIEKANGFGPAR